jgi:hypothetical protein
VVFSTLCPLEGGDKPHHYKRSFTEQVGVGFIPISANLFLRRETVEGSLKKRTSNIERPTSNAEWEKIKQQTNDLE